MYTKAQLRRTDACVSACEGLSTEELEKGLVGDMITALSCMTAESERDGHISTSDYYGYHLAKSVLARAKGGE